MDFLIARSRTAIAQLLAVWQTKLLVKFWLGDIDRLNVFQSRGEPSRLRVTARESKLPIHFQPMSASLAQDAIALLIELAQKGEIDPWDVRVIEVVDRYLSGLALTPMPTPVSGASPYHADLSRSGQAFLYASMLVWLKADSLLRSASFFDDEEDLDGEEWLEDPVENGFSLPLRLERQLRRRAVAPPPRKRRVTLSEMIEQLEVMAATLAEPDRPPRRRRNRAIPKAQAAGEIAQLAHQENLTETAEELDQFLTQNWSNFAIKGDKGLPFDRLLHLWSQACPVSLSHASPTSHQVALFWALLLLSSQSKVELSQNEFYQDLTIRPIVEPERTIETMDRSD